MLKVLLVMGLAVACQGYDDDYWKACFDGGTYKYGPNSTVPCICHVSFSNPFCSRQEKECSDSQCNNGRCVFVHGSYECECKEGFWGRLCEHTDAEVAHLNATTEADLALKHCRGEKDCPIEPPHLKVVCSNEDLDLCDEEGNVRPFKKCPYPWYCYEAFRNGKCDWECERSECLYDGYECSSNRVCSATCLTRSGACDMECEMQQEYFKNKTNANPSLATGTIIEFTLGVSEQFWWENKNEIIANISEPLRTPLIYSPKHNDVLEKNKNFKIRSRRRRSISNTVKVWLELLSKFCPNEASCAKSASTASQQVSVDAKKDGSGIPFIERVASASKPKSFGNGTLAGKDPYP